MHRQQAMDLGRQRAYTSIRALPIEEHVKKVVFTLFFYQIVYKGQTITTLADNGRKGFRAFCIVVLEVGNGQQWSKRQPGRK